MLVNAPNLIKAIKLIFYKLYRKSLEVLLYTFLANFACKCTRSYKSKLSWFLPKYIGNLSRFFCILFLQIMLVNAPNLIKAN